LTMKRVLIALPAYNEAKFIKNVLFEIFKYAPKKNILVVNDGSTDLTCAVATDQGVTVANHTENQGKGAALLTAFGYALKNGYDWIICMDSDGQHEAKFLPLFFQRIEATEATMILGNRVERALNMPFHRILSNGVTSIILTLLSGKERIHDSQCGFRAMRMDSLRFSTLNEKGFLFESELLLHNCRSGGSIEEVAISTTYGNESSSISLIKDTMRFIKLVLYYIWK
jgi:glycosyltransferase involved in cell wall biosynthesis